MHRISNLNIANYKAIRAASFEFSNYSPIVGYNNAGKSSILEALAWVVKPYSIARTGFNDPENPIVITVNVDGIGVEVLDGLTDNHRARIEPFLVNSQLRFRRTQLIPGDSVTRIRLEIFDPNGANDWVLNPTGISSALSALFPEVIVVGAMENAADDVGKNTSGSTIGKLIKQIVEPVKQEYAPRIADALLPISNRLSAQGDQKDQILVDVDSKIETYLDAFFPGMKARTHIPMPEIEDILKKATIQVSEDRYGDDLEGDAATMGHGAQRSIQIALINALADIRRGEGSEVGRTVLLLLDEPELYLHPQAIAVVRTALKQLSNRGFQVAFTTHTGELIATEDAANTLIIRRTPAEGCGPLQRLTDVASVIADGNRQADILFELSNSKEFLFSDKIILVEGPTEAMIFPQIYEKMTAKTLHENRIGLIRLNGSGNLKKAFDVLQAMGIDPCVITDLDYVFKTAVQNGMIGAVDSRIDEIRGISNRLAGEGHFVVGGDGFPKNSDICRAEAGFEIIAQDEQAAPLIADLLFELREQRFWVWSRGAIEPHVGIVEKNYTARRQFVEGLKDADISANFPDHESIQRLIEFI